LKKNLTISTLQKTAFVFVIAGALGSLAFTFSAGRNNKSVLLILLFAIWVLSPFIALIIANIFSSRWSVPARRTLYSLVIFLTICSLIGYSGVLSPPGTKTAFVFLVIPLLSWILMVIAAILSRRLSHKNSDV
jgi:hypothetical protein